MLSFSWGKYACVYVIHSSGVTHVHRFLRTMTEALVPLKCWEHLWLYSNLLSNITWRRTDTYYRARLTAVWFFQLERLPSWCPKNYTTQLGVCCNRYYGNKCIQYFILSLFNNVMMHLQNSP